MDDRVSTRVGIAGQKICLYARYTAVIRIQFKNRIIRAAFFTTDRVVPGFGASGDCKCQSYQRDLC